MSTRIVGWWFCMMLLATAAVACAQSSNNIVLTLEREYGRALYTQCRLGVVVFERQGRVSLWCALNMPGGKQLSAERALTSKEAAELPALVAASDLCGSGHIGRDDTASDGILETLQTRCPGGTVAVVVTSGNPTFQPDGARRSLLDRLYSLEKDLQRKAPEPK
jgi:hypothetical protein